MREDAVPPPAGGARSGQPFRPPMHDARTLRPGSSIAVGVVGAAAGLAVLVPAIVAPARSWVLIASVTLALVLLWLFVVRPCGRLHADGIRLVNPMRVVDLTWPAITEVRSKWALELFADEVRYTAWGIPADPKRPRYGRGALLIGANRVARAGRAGAGVPSPAEPTSPKVEAQTVALEVEQRIRAHRRRTDDRIPRIALQRWDSASVALLLAALAFLGVAIIVG